MSFPTPSFLEQGRQALAQQNLPLAIQLLGRAVAANPNDAGAMALLGMAYSQAGQHAQARQYLQGAAQRQPQNAGFRYQLGLMLERAGDPVGAAQAYQEALRINPGFGDAQTRLAGLRSQPPSAISTPGMPARQLGVRPRPPVVSAPSYAPTPRSSSPHPAPAYAPPPAPSRTPWVNNPAIPDMNASEAFWRRAGARLIDLALLWALDWGVLLVGSMAMTGLVSLNPQSDALLRVGSLGLFFSWFVAPSLVTVTYLTWMHCARGQTVGQMALGIRLMSADGRPPVFPQTLFRDTIGMLASGLLCGLGLFWMLWDPNQQTWGDKMSSTYVRRA